MSGMPQAQKSMFPLEMLGYVGLILAVTGYILWVVGTDFMQTGGEPASVGIFMAILAVVLLVTGIPIRKSPVPVKRGRSGWPAWSRSRWTTTASPERSRFL
jgi:cytochrome b subunit of formate dehydrogenase